jgi:hypothetical protein
MNWFKSAQQGSCQDIISRIDSKYSLSENQSGDIDNLASIGSTLNQWQELKGIRDIPTLCSGAPSESLSSLAMEIQSSGFIMPLIVVCESDRDEGLYILEGSHRYDAICELGYEKFPALVVVDTESCNELV